MQIKILGCGPSVGVPSISCSCRVCKSSNTRNQRLRTSICIDSQNTKILIDSGPDLRRQALSNNVSYIDAVFYTHMHADHIAGIHELVAFPPADDYSEPIVPIYGDNNTIEYLQDNYSYLFFKKRSFSAPWNKSYLLANIVDYYKEFYIKKIKFLIFPQEHGSVTSSGMIVNDEFAYCTDVKKIPEKALNLLKNTKLKLLIIECFCYTEAKAHANFLEAIAWIKDINPEKAIFTHMNHDVDYDEIVSKLAREKIYNTEPAYDGMIINI